MEKLKKEINDLVIEYEFKLEELRKLKIREEKIKSEIFVLKRLIQMNVAWYEKKLTKNSKIN